MFKAFYTLTKYLLTAILLFIILIVIGKSQGWSFTHPNNKEFWLLLGAFITVATFIYERFENLTNKRNEIQLKFFDKWQDRKTKIEQLNPEGDEEAARILFRRYFELLSLEYLMQSHISPKVYRQWKDHRKLEFKDDRLYAGKKYKEWWDELSPFVVNKKFKTRMDKCRA